jgi:hypothetical protein
MQLVLQVQIAFAQQTIAHISPPISVTPRTTRQAPSHRIDVLLQLRAFREAWIIVRHLADVIDGPLRLLGESGGLQLDDAIDPFLDSFQLPLRRQFLGEQHLGIMFALLRLPSPRCFRDVWRHHVTHRVPSIDLQPVLRGSNSPWSARHARCETADT